MIKFQLPGSCGERKIGFYIEDAIPFYEKLGMKKANDVMQYKQIEWTEFTVQQKNAA